MSYCLELLEEVEDIVWRQFSFKKMCKDARIWRPVWSVFRSVLLFSLRSRILWSFCCFLCLRRLRSHHILLTLLLTVLSHNNWSKIIEAETRFLIWYSEPTCRLMGNFQFSSFLKAPCFVSVLSLVLLMQSNPGTDCRLPPRTGTGGWVNLC